MNMKTNVKIINYRMGNIGSVTQALVECGAVVNTANYGEELKDATHVILPGVGAFGDGIKNLIELGFVEVLKDYILKKGIPVLGICLGMQLLADKGNEGGESNGIGLIPGEIIKLKPFLKAERIPHIGWNELYKKRESELLQNIPDGADFYFVHSYHFNVKNNNNILAVTPYCKEFVSVIVKDNIFGTQFHPEKSSIFGFQILKNFLKI